MSRVTITDSQRAQVLALHAKGTGRNEIAAKAGISTGSVTKIVHAAGHSFDRTKTATAVAARQVDLADRRTRIIDRMYSRTEALLDRLEADTFDTILKASFGEEIASRLAFVPARDVRDLASSISQLASQAARLEAVGSPEAEKVKGLLGDIADQLGLA